jgi:hypothetical protein
MVVNIFDNFKHWDLYLERTNFFKKEIYNFRDKIFNRILKFVESLVKKSFLNLEEPFDPSL